MKNRLGNLQPNYSENQFLTINKRYKSPYKTCMIERWQILDYLRQIDLFGNCQKRKFQLELSSASFFSRLSLRKSIFFCLVRSIWIFLRHSTHHLRMGLKDRMSQPQPI